MHYFIHLIYKQLHLYIIYEEATRLSIAQRRFISDLYFSNQIKLDLKSTNQEFFLFLKLLKKHSIQYFTQRRIEGCCNIQDGALCDNHKALHLGCCNSPTSASRIMNYELKVVLFVN